MCALLEVIEELRADKRTAVSAPSYYYRSPQVIITAVITHLMREYCRAAADNESRFVGYVAFILGTLCRTGVGVEPFGDAHTRTRRCNSYSAVRL